jgi:hypothetical protein
MGGVPLGRERIQGGIYYRVQEIEQMNYHLTMLAYDMKNEPLSCRRGTPLRPRNGAQLGFKTGCVIATRLIVGG